jgi:hypothetical protein
MRVVATLELTAKIGEFADGWNECGQHFAWTEAADELLVKSEGKRLPARDTSSHPLAAHQSFRQLSAEQVITD